jgi:hypothetical protein
VADAPQPSPSRSRAAWLAFAAWALLIFATVPFARALERVVVETLGAQAFLAAALAALLLGGAFAWRTFAQVGARARVALACGVALYAAVAWRLRGNAVEAVHIVEYGALGLLALRALTFGPRDALLAPGAALLAACVGLVDEGLQWLTPKRVWDLRDVGINALAAAGGPALLALGVAPAWSRARASAAGGRRFLALLALAWTLLGASLLNTSARVASLARVAPALAAQDAGMVDYGALHQLLGAGEFPSRLEAGAWARADAARANEGGAALAENVRAQALAPRDAELSPYETFLAEHTAVSDPFLHELRVHLFRRDRYVETADAHRDDDAWRARDMTVAVRENAFLERFALRTLAAGQLAWSETERAERSALDLGTPYRSRVAEAVVTRVRERDVAIAWALGYAALGAAALRLRAKR